MAAYYAANREIILVKKAAYRAANPGKAAETTRAWRAANPEKVAKANRYWQIANPEKHAAATRAWQAANPEKAAQYTRNRRALKKNAEGSHTVADVRTIFENQRGLCSNCQAKLFKSGKQKFHVDHVMPLALGGSNDKYNIQCLCPTCNLSKHAKDPLEWAKQQGRLL